jgi:hypothetical protein
MENTEKGQLAQPHVLSGVLPMLCYVVFHLSILSCKKLSKKPPS